MQCLDCETASNKSKCVVFLVCEDIKGKFVLCSECWIIRDKEMNPPEKELVTSSKKRKRRR